jgi:hypothetical protein
VPGEGTSFAYCTPQASNSLEGNPSWRQALRGRRGPRSAARRCELAETYPPSIIDIAYELCLIVVLPTFPPPLRWPARGLDGADWIGRGMGFEALGKTGVGCRVPPPAPRSRRFHLPRPYSAPL